MAAMAYNLKKYLKFEVRKVMVQVKEAIIPLYSLIMAICHKIKALLKQKSQFSIAWNESVKINILLYLISLVLDFELN